MENKEKARIIELPRIYDPRGNLTFVENTDGLMPFKIERVYWIYDVPAGEARGGHAHRQGQEILIALSGSLTVKLFDGRERSEFLLNRPFQGLYMPPGYWRTMDNFSSGSVLMVLSSVPYSEDDYIRDYDDFLSLKA